MTYRTVLARTCLTLLPLALALSACRGEENNDDAAGDTSETDTETTGDGDGDGDGDGAPGDGDGEPDPNFPSCTCAEFDGQCFEVGADDEEGLQVAANSLEDGGALVLGLGVFELDNQVTIRADGITVCGQGKGTEGSLDEGTILDFATQVTQSNGLDIVGDDVVVRDLAIIDAKKDGLRIEDSQGVVIQRVRATWRNIEDPNNGSYGLYPVKVSHVLIEDSEAYNSSDAGIYVGQCQHAIVRNNVAKGNVAGIEIENTQFADVYGNLAEDNTGGLLIFDLPGNPVIGRDIHIHDNIVRNNNTTNFAPGGTVREIPVGTGTFAMASRRVLIENNTYEGNGTADIAILSGLVIEGDEAVWGLSVDELVGDISGLDLPTEGDTVFNYRTDNVVIRDNSHSGSGTNPFLSTVNQPFGVLIASLYASNLPVDQILYDAIGESAHSPMDIAGNSNDNILCVGDTNTGAAFGSLNVPYLLDNLAYENVYRPDAPFVPFDCDAFVGEPIIGPDME